MPASTSPVSVLPVESLEGAEESGSQAPPESDKIAIFPGLGSNASHTTEYPTRNPCSSILAASTSHVGERRLQGALWVE